MKKSFIIVLAVLAIAMLAVVAVSAADEIKVVNLINGVLGDKSFFDSSNRGMQRVVADYPNVSVKSIEAGIDPAKWQAALEDAAANEEYDVMILGTWQMSEFLELVAPMYPDKFFIIYDVSVNYELPDLDNVYSVTYKQNEGSYVAGVLAALVSESKIVGVIGGQDIPVINDFIAGYKQGALEFGATNVIVQYAGGWNDPAKGKELALAMYQQGADVVFQVAGGTGEGVFQAALEMGKLAIGVDSDQATIIADTNPELAKVIVSSMLKNVDNSLYRAMVMHMEGTLPYGTAEALGIVEGGVGIAKNDIYNASVSDEIKAKIDAAEKNVIEGTVKVDTAIN